MIAGPNKSDLTLWHEDPADVSFSAVPITTTGNNAFSITYLMD
jgi:hypothetical protein